MAAAALLIAGAAWYRARPYTTARLLQRLPADDALVLGVDFEALRRAGILQLLDGAQAGQDPEYQTFVRKTNFDYQRDLRRALAAFAPTGKFLLLEGRFDWPRLRAYAVDQGGGCERDLCRMQGSAPERQISFFALRSSLMALAVSPDRSAVLRLATPAPGPPPAAVDAPVWLSVPATRPARLREPRSPLVTAGTR